MGYADRLSHNILIFVNFPLHTAQSRSMSAFILQLDSIMSRKSVHVVPSSQGGWDVKTGGASRAAKHTEVKAPAIDRAREIARNQRAELVIHNKNGRIAQSDSHGHDPNPPKG